MWMRPGWSLFIMFLISAKSSFHEKFVLFIVSKSPPSWITLSVSPYCQNFWDHHYPSNSSTTLFSTSHLPLPRSSLHFSVSAIQTPNICRTEMRLHLRGSSPVCYGIKSLFQMAIRSASWFGGMKWWWCIDSGPVRSSSESRYHVAAAKY